MCNVHYDMVTIGTYPKFVTLKFSLILNVYLSNSTLEFLGHSIAKEVGGLVKLGATNASPNIPML